MKKDSKIDNRYTTQLYSSDEITDKLKELRKVVEDKLSNNFSSFLHN